MNGINKALSLCKKQSFISRVCGVSQASVKKWLNGGKMDVRYIPKIIEATGFQVDPTELRADVDWETIYKSLKNVYEK